MKSVLIIVENLPVPFDRRVWLEATALRQAGYEVTVICPKGKGHVADHEVIDGVVVYRHDLPPETGSKLDYLREYAAALAHEFRLALRARRERGFDVVHVCNPPDLLFLVAGFWKLFAGAKVVFDHHDVGPELYVEKFGRKDLFYRALLLAERLTFATADVVITTNESYRRVALERGRKSPGDVFVVRSAPDLERFRPTPPDPAVKRGARFLVGYVGVMAEQDGVDRLIRVAHDIVNLRRRRDVRFLLIGGGPRLDSLRALAAELELGEHVEFAGFRSGDELVRLLSSCDVCASPDPISEYNHMCTMNKVMEYMALGKPVVQFDLVEGRVSAGEASLYATDVEDFAAKVVQLLDDEDLRHRLGEAGLKRMRDVLGWSHQVPNLLAAYRRLFA